MGAWWWALVAFVVLLLVGLYLSMTAGRLDRLHRRIDTYDVGVRRAGAAVSGLLGVVAALAVGG